MHLPFGGSLPDRNVVRGISGAGMCKNRPVSVMKAYTMRLVSALALAGGMSAMAACASRPASPARLRVALSFPPSAGTAALDGRLLLLLSADGAQEPRFQISDNDRTQQIGRAHV